MVMRSAFSSRGIELGDSSVEIISECGRARRWPAPRLILERAVR
jgi:hypothetical protein